MPPPRENSPPGSCNHPSGKGKLFIHVFVRLCVCVWGGGGGGGGVYGTYFTTLLIRDSFYYDLEIIAKLSKYVKKQPMNKN